MCVWVVCNRESDREREGERERAREREREKERARERGREKERGKREGERRERERREGVRVGGMSTNERVRVCARACACVCAFLHVCMLPMSSVTSCRATNAVTSRFMRRTETFSKVSYYH